MQFTTALIALVASISAVSAQGTCTSPQSSVDYKFEIATQNVTNPNPTVITNAECNTNPIVSLTTGGVLTDQSNRRGEVVANQQFQFDVILQSGRKYDDGFSICTYSDGAVRLQHQGSDSFYSCLSGGFSNLYDSSIGNQCTAIYINIVQCAGTAGTVTAPGPISSQGPAADDGNAAPTASSSSTSSSTSSISTTPASSSATSTAAVSSTLVSTTAAASPAVVAPFPTGNSTAVAGTAKATTATTTSKPATFTAGSGAGTLAIGAKLVALVAGVAAFALA
ncbi:hypothetical protein P7C71_g3217, partial [Lecanoromycetidae sp. Uapishka_2]